MISRPEVASRITMRSTRWTDDQRDSLTIFQLQARGVATGPDLREEIVAWSTIWPTCSASPRRCGWAPALAATSVRR